MSPVQLAAAIYGCRVEELLSYREYEDGSVVIIAPSGQKFAYSAEAIMQFVLGEESPPAPLDKGGEEAAQATLRATSSVAVAAPLGKGGEESPQATLSVAAPIDKGGAEARLPLFENGGMVTADAEPGGSEAARGSKGGRGSKGDKGRK
jgi:hypothetical protein